MWADQISSFLGSIKRVFAPVRRLIKRSTKNPDNLITNKPNLEIEKHFPFGKLFISLIRPAVVTSIRSASFVLSLTVSEICGPSQN